MEATSPDEAITRAVCLGELVNESIPDALVCVVDATNLRLHLRFALEGSTSSITSKFTKTRSVYYKFTLKLMNLKTGLVEWQDEQEIRKTGKTGLLGM